jgi:phosphotransferase system enzyme I (PtsI)
MQRIQGIAVSPGIAIGEALVMDNEGFRIPHRFVSRDAVEDELERFEHAIAASAVEIERNRDTVSRELGKEYGAIFEAQLQMLLDQKLRSEVVAMVSQQHYSPEYSVSRILRRYIKVFQGLESRYLADRANDVVDVERRLLRNLLGRRREEISRLTSPVLVLAHNLTPGETANLDRRYVKGFVCEVGGPGSHSAIVACALEIPAVVGMGHFLTDVSGGDLVIIDGNRGEVILHPDEEIIARYRHEAEQSRTLAVRLESLRDLPAETCDGTRIELMGSIEFPDEVEHCLDRGSDGVGLFRTEFLYLQANAEPSEEEHFKAYRHVAEAMGERPVVIRTYDLGADKTGEVGGREEERNPFLGLRSIRMSLRNLPRFRTQLRAILRASVSGNLRVMFPLISTVMELRQAKMVLADVMEDLEENGVPFHRDLPIGMMVEVPSAVMMMEHFVKEVDFISIGTNDLVQYTLAVDRDNKEVANLFNACDPAVLKLIDLAIREAHKGEIEVNICGQMAGNPIYCMLILGLGARQLGVAPSAIPEIKKICRSVSIEDCRALARHVIAMENARDVKSYLKEELRKILPEFAI